MAAPVNFAAPLRLVLSLPSTFLVVIPLLFHSFLKLNEVHIGGRVEVTHNLVSCIQVVEVLVMLLICTIILVALDSNAAARLVVVHQLVRLIEVRRQVGNLALCEFGNSEGCVVREGEHREEFDSDGSVQHADDSVGVTVVVDRRVVPHRPDLHHIRNSRGVAHVLAEGDAEVGTQRVGGAKLRLLPPQFLIAPHRRRLDAPLDGLCELGEVIRVQHKFLARHIAIELLAGWVEAGGYSYSRSRCIIHRHCIRRHNAHWRLDDHWVSEHD
mmetsp:Transcript_12496/g.18876  ORF Transcript_12496/g.18876 Transcript_12496/m.18876 type:complete len:270 (+) Transcript_12496:235-1044(+)